MDSFRLLDENIKKINHLKKEGSAIATLEKRIELLSFCMGIVERIENDLLVYKESHKDINVKEILNLDYQISDYAERFYIQANIVKKVMLANMQNDAVKIIPMVKKTTFLDLMKRMMEISARWHIERIINVYEFDMDVENRSFPKRKELLKECIFFADRMNATKMGVNFADKIMPQKIIFAVQPSSGKSFVANVYSLMTLCLHHIYYKTSGILRMSNNTTNAMGFSNQIMGMIENEKIATIYPEFKGYFTGGKSRILEKSTSEEWKMAGLDPRIRASHFAKGRESAINSIRVFVALIIDDLSDGFFQMNNDEAHQDMTRSFYVDIEPRAEGENIPEFILGTMFNEFGLQNTMINKLETEEGLIKDPKYRNVRRTPDYSAIVIEVDCFDEKGESVAPKLISTKALRDRQNSLKPYEFDLVYRQISSSREPRIFDYKNLKTYTSLPDTLIGHKIAILDPTRVNGADFFSLPVFDFDRETNEAYFIDCIYEQKSLGKIADPHNKFFTKVMKFLIDNGVNELCIENNTSNTLGILFEERFKNFNYNCRVLEFYTAKEKGLKNKTQRIVNEEPTITANIHFPAKSMYPPLHRISQFMNDFTTYDSKLPSSNKKQHDDAPDSVALFSKRYLFSNKNRFSTINKSFSMKNLFKI